MAEALVANPLADCPDDEVVLPEPKKLPEALWPTPLVPFHVDADASDAEGLGVPQTSHTVAVASLRKVHCAQSHGPSPREKSCLRLVSK